MLVGLIVLALAFDFLNGLHDAANSIATVVSTRVLRPLTAVFWAAFFNFIALAIFGLHVAQTLGTGIIDPAAVDAGVIFGALVGAIAWNVASWLLAFPTSSSHALIGGLLGAGIAHAGLSAVVWSGVIKTAFGIVLAPLSGFVVAVTLVIAVSWMSARSLPFAVDRRFRHLQLVSAALYSLGHGGNDAQKTMGVIAILLYSSGTQSGSFHVPLWVILSCQAAMALGTLCGAGASFGQWARGSPISPRCRVGAPRQAARQPCLPPPGWAFPSRRRTQLPAASSAWVRCADFRRCVGAWPAIS